MIWRKSNTDLPMYGFHISSHFTAALKASHTDESITSPSKSATFSLRTSCTTEVPHTLIGAKKALRIDEFEAALAVAALATAGSGGCKGRAG